MRQTTAWSFVIVVFGVLCNEPVSTLGIPKSFIRRGSDLPIRVDVEETSGKQYNLELKRAGGSVLHPNINYLVVNRDQETGRRTIETWKPSSHELHTANKVYIDHKNRAVVRLSHDENENRVLDGIVNEMKFQERDGIVELLQNESDDTHHHDYIDTNVKLTYNNMKQQAIKTASEDSQDYVVEIAIVCDKEWGDKFQNDRQKILNYWSVYFWDVNMRYKTLPRSNISFRITSIIVIQSIEEQPFVEESRDEQGRAVTNVVLGKFSEWIWNQKEELPKFDMAVAVLGTATTYADGMAYLRGACQHRTGTAVWGDGGYWGSTWVAAHEIGHNLGAPHDDEDPTCNATGYIMGGAAGLTQFHFSECSDRSIGAYVRSDQAACLQRLDEGSEPVVSPDFNTVVAPTFDEQCKALFGPESDLYPDISDCTLIYCWQGDFAKGMLPVDNSICGDDDSGHCFRGRCYSNSGLSFLVNVASGQCLLGTDRFSGNDTAQMSNCPSVPSPLNQFRTMPMQRGRHFMTLYSTYGVFPDVNKCLVGSAVEGGQAGFGKCSTVAGNLSEWSLEEVGDGEYTLKEATTNRCLKQEGNLVKVFASCDRNDRTMRWKITLEEEECSGPWCRGQARD